MYNAKIIKGSGPTYAGNRSSWMDEQSNTLVARHTLLLERPSQLLAVRIPQEAWFIPPGRVNKARGTTVRLLVLSLMFYGIWHTMGRVVYDYFDLQYCKCLYLAEISMHNSKKTLKTSDISIES